MSLIKASKQEVDDVESIDQFINQLAGIRVARSLEYALLTGKDNGSNTQLLSRQPVGYLGKCLLDSLSLLVSLLQVRRMPNWLLWQGQSITRTTFLPTLALLRVRTSTIFCWPLLTRRQAFVSHRPQHRPVDDRGQAPVCRSKLGNACIQRSLVARGALRRL